MREEGRCWAAHTTAKDATAIVVRLCARFTASAPSAFLIAVSTKVPASGLPLTFDRREEAATRGQAPIVARDLRGLVKVNPLATWTQADVAGYIVDHDVPVNPLRDQGYLSIGCMPCTQLPTDPDDPRSGRWAGMGKTECGIHD